MLKNIKNSIQLNVFQCFILKLIGCLLIIFFITNCAQLKQIRSSDALANAVNLKNSLHHSGFLMVDLKQNDTLYAYNNNRFFIPASTIKLFTLYTALRCLSDTLPALKYHQDNRKLIAIPVGDPTWLHPHFKNKKPLEFLEQFDSIFLYTDNYYDEKLGLGWAWEDYPYYFSPERSSLPLYGNVLSIKMGDSLKVKPAHFFNQVNFNASKSGREWGDNRFYIAVLEKDSLQIPYITSKELTRTLLSKAISKPIIILDSIPKNNWNILPSISRDSVLKRMLQKSDNFLAEQLMLLCASTISDSLSFKRVKDFIINDYLNTIAQKPRWVDGSGLSRYNLFTPKSMVYLLGKLHSETDSIRLFSLLPKWNQNGTIPESDEAFDDAFIFAKSGSMSNVYNLCGFLKTKSGRLFAFSFMNNHFRKPSREIRQHIFHTLQSVHDAY